MYYTSKEVDYEEVQFTAPDTVSFTELWGEGATFVYKKA